APRATPHASAAANSLQGAFASSATLYPEGTSFADVLASVSQTAGTSLAAAATQLNASGVPTSLAGYGNGRIPETALAPLTGSGERMWAPAAEHLNNLLADAKKAGVAISITDGYRDYDSQVRVADQKGLYSQGGLAAAPGTSEHGWGLAVDLGLDATSQAWMRQHAKEYGFVENVPREPWHWEFAPAS
ncbi:MAG: peptidase M15, partial [Demequinaceae bacterium]|nr:peptidase M15 [Demequinaceae bacterium]